MKKTTLLATTIGLVGAFASSASHAILFTPTQTESFSLILGSVDSQDLTFDGFDATLGELMSVHLSFEAEAFIESQVFNINAGAPDEPASYGVPSLVSASYSLTVEDTGGIISASDFLQTPGASGTITNNDSPETIGTDAGVLTDTTVLNDPPIDLSSFIGGVNAVTMTIDGTAFVSGSVNNPVFISNSASADGEVRLFYDYERAEVPAPGALALLGLGLAGLTLVRRRKAT